MRVLILFCLVFFSCYNPYHNRDENREKQREKLVLLGLYFGGCKFASTNPLWIDSYYDRYALDLNQYSTLILGDSTMDIACRFPGYKGSATTGCFPVSGNKIPDFQDQLCVLNSRNPSTIVISTMGGNDLLTQVPNDEIIARGRRFADVLQKIYPNAKKYWVQVHATRVDYANRNRGVTNKGISDYIQGLGWVAVDPDSCIVPDSSGTAPQSYLLDSIHPNEASSFCIKNKIGVSY